MKHREQHRTHRTGWLRAAVLGANDGILSTASLILGVAASGGSAKAVLVAGASGLVAGAMAMAAGEYVSVCSQADTESADLAREKEELAANPDNEHQELASIYVGRGLDKDLASRVANQLMAHDALGAHGRDELGISNALAAKPVQAAMASAGAYTSGAALPLVMALMLPRPDLFWGVACVSLFSLTLLGVLAARTGGAPVLASVLRISFWGSFAMGVTAAVGALFGHV
jgi:VIT1/CCC1 family predicted Fe2+/Mn2+ transporter